jgi:hypothetical protein
MGTLDIYNPQTNRHAIFEYQVQFFEIPLRGFENGKISYSQASFGRLEQPR